MTSFPFTCGFEESSDADYWAFANGANGWFIGTAAHNGENSAKGLYISNDGGTTYSYSGNSNLVSYAWATLTLSTAAQYEISFDWKNYGEGSGNYDYVRVFLAPAATELTAGQRPDGVSVTSYSQVSGYASTTPEGWIDLADGKLNGSNSWNTKTKSFSVTTNGDYKLVFMWIQDNGGDVPGAIDNVVINAYTCLAPTLAANAVSNITTTGARVTWTDAANSSPTYTFYNGNNVFGSADITPEAGEGENEYYYDLTGLTPNTPYNLTLKAHCGGEDYSAAATVPSFRTACGAITSLATPYTYGFESAENQSGSYPLPYCWSRNVGAYSGSYSHFPYSYSAGSRTGSNSLYFYGGSSSSYPDTMIAVLPEMADGLIATAQLSFYAKLSSAPSSSYSALEMQVGTISDPADASTFQAVQTFTVNSATYSEFLTYFPTTTDHHMAILVKRPESKYNYLYIDDVTISTAPACKKVANVDTSNVAATGARISWTNRFHADGMTYTFKQGDDVLANAVSATAGEGANEYYYDLTGLTPNRPYSVTVTANCTGEAGSSEPSLPVSFRTLCGESESIPYNENFDSYAQSNSSSAVKPACWTFVPEATSYSNGFCVYSDGVESSNSLYGYSSSTHNYKAILPVMAQETNTLMVSFKWKSYSSYYAGKLDVGYITNLADASTFVAVESLSSTNTSTFTEVEVMLDGAPDGARIAFRSSGASYSGVYIDNVQVKAIPNCRKVTEVAVGARTATTAVLTWNTTVNAATTVYKVYDNGSEGDTLLGTSEAGASTITLTGLTPATTYNRVKIITDCSASDEGVNADSVSVPTFATRCNPIDIPAAGLVYDFETSEGFTATSNPTTNTLGACWRNETTVAGTGSYPDRLWGVSTTYKKSGSQSLRLNDKGNSSSPATTMLVFPAMNFTATSGYQVEFWIYRDANGSNEEGFRVYASATDTVAANAINLGTYSRNYGQEYPVVESASGWYHYQTPVIEHSALNGTAYIIFEGHSFYGNATHVDSVVIKQAPTCYKPTAASVIADSTTTTAAALRWTPDERNAEGGSYTILMERENEDDLELSGSTTPAVSFKATNDTALLSGLTPNTTYTFKIRTNCANAAETENIELITLDPLTTQANCPAPTAVVVPDSTIAARQARVHWVGPEQAGSYNVLVGEQEAGSVTYDFENNAIPAGFTNDATRPWTVVSDKTHTDGGTYCIKSGNGGVNSSSSEISINVTLSAEGTVSFKYKISSESSYDKGYFYIDNTVESTINGISGAGTWLSYSKLLGVGTHTLKWKYTKDNSTANNDDCFYVDDITIPTVTVNTWGEPQAATDTTLLITGLEPETGYGVKVTSVCGGDNSDASEVVLFTTKPSCMPIDSVKAVDTTATTYTFRYYNHPLNPTASVMVVKGTDTLSSTTTPSVEVYLENHQVTLGGLEDGKAYAASTFKAYADCGSEDGFSSNGINVPAFTTKCGAKTIPFTENFENGSNDYSPSRCWVVPTSSASNAWKRSTNNAHGGTHSLYSSLNNSNNTDTTFAVLPEMNAATNTLQVRFWSKVSSINSSGTLTVGYTTEIDDIAGYFVEVSTVDATADYTEVTVEMPAAAPAAARIVLRHQNTTSTYVNWYIDDLTVEPIPDCKRVQGVAVSNITSTAATVTVTDTKNEGATYYVYDTTGGTVTEMGYSDPQSEQPLVVTLTGLTPATQYNKLVVVAKINNGADVSDSVLITPSFTTLKVNTDIASFTISTSGVTRGTADIDATAHTVTMPVFYLSESEIRALNGSIMTASSSGATIKMLKAGSTDNWISASFAALCDTLQMNTPLTVRVFAEDVNVYQDWAITLQGEDCNRPRNMAFTNVERRAFTATWDYYAAAEADFQLVYSTTELDAEGLADATPEAVNGATTYTAAGLDRGTTYHVYVRTVCGTDNYSEWVHSSVTTGTLTECVSNVADGSTTSSYYFPYSAWHHNSYTQQLYTAEETGVSVGQSITALKFNYKSSTSTTRNITLYLGTTEATSLSSAWATPENMTEVFHAANVTLTNEDNNWFTITFDEPFTYNGGNLVVATFMNYTTDETNYGNHSDFYLHSASSMARSVTSDATTTDTYTITNGVVTGSSNTGSSASYRNNIRFCYSSDPCPAVASIEVSDITETGATVTWTAATGDYLTGYQVIQSETELDAAALEAYTGPYVYVGAALTCDLSGLDAYTQYYIYVRANCGAPDNTNSTWQSASFRTKSACGVAENVSATITGKKQAHVSWTMSKPDQDKNFTYIYSTTAIPEASLDGTTAGRVDGFDQLSVDLTGLANGTTYHFYIQNNCGAAGISPWDSVTFETYEAWPVVLNLAASNISYNAFTATWNRNLPRFATEIAWQYAVVEHTTPATEPTNWTIVTDSTLIVTGRTPGMEYDLHVRPCNPAGTAYGNDEIISVITTALPSVCDVTVADGTTTNSSVPIYSYNQEAHARVQIVYPGTELQNLVGKTITSLTFYPNSTASSSNGWENNEFVLSLAMTEQNSLATAWDATATTTVHTGAVPTVSASEGMVFEFNTPFEYTGGNLLVELNNPGNSNSKYTTISFVGVTGVSGSSRYANGNSYYQGNGTASNFLPKVQFCYEPAYNPTACMDVVENTITVNAEPRTATVTWYPGNVETAWQYVYSTEEITDFSEVTLTDNLTRSVTLTGLTPETDYHFYVKPVCDGAAWSHKAFTTVVSCGVPELADADDITAHTATLGVTASETGTPVSYQFKYWITGGGADDTVTVTVSSPTATLAIEDLLGNTPYTYKARTLCDVDANDYSQWTATKSFRTECADLLLVDLPLTWTFEAAELPSTSGYPMPWCWSRLNSNTESNYPYSYYSTYARNGSRSLYFPSSTTETMYARLPKLDASLSAGAVQLVYWARTTSSGNVTVTAGTMNDEGVFHDFGQSAVVEGATYRQYKSTFTMTGENANDRYIALRVVTPGAAVYIDDVTLRRKLACEEPVDLASTGTTSSTIALQWTKVCSNVMPSGYELIRGTEEGDTLHLAANQVTTDGNTVSYTLTGLTANKQYGPFRVAAVINATDTTEYSAQLAAIRTLNNQDSIKAFNIADGTGNPVRRGDAVFGTDHDITMPVYYTADFSGTHADVVTLTLSTGAKAYFYDPATATLGKKATAANLKDTLAMDRVLTLRVFAEDSANAHQDWTIALEPEACCTPRNLTFPADELGRRNFTATWTAADPAAENFQLMICKHAIDTADHDAMATALAHTDSVFTVEGAKTYTVTGLERNTQYHVYVRTLCGESYSSWIIGTVRTKALADCDNPVEGPTVADGTTTNNFVPVYGGYVDSYQRNQFVYPATDIASLAGRQITGMTFFASQSSVSWSGVTFKVYLTETANASISAFANVADMTQVYEGSLAISDNEMTITFATPFAYSGTNNLLVAIDNTTKGSYSSSTWNGITSNGSSVGGYSYSSLSEATVNQRNFLPKVTFSVCSEGIACPAVENVEVSDIEENGATISWDESTADYPNGYQLIVSDTAIASLDTVPADASYLVDAPVNSYVATNLAAYTNYHVYVRAKCAEADEASQSSDWTAVTFRTLSTCGTVVFADDAVAITGKHTATVSWTKSKATQTNNFDYIVGTTAYDVEADEETLNGLTPTGTAYAATSLDLTELESATTYYVYVRNNCGTDGNSPWKSVSFTTYDAMPAVVDLTVDEITHSAARISWAKNVEQYADETQWQVAAVGRDLEPEAADWSAPVSEMQYTFLGLTAATNYDFHVRPYQASPEATGTDDTVHARTADAPTACVTVGDGTSGYYYFFPGFYGYHYSAFLYDMSQSGNIEKLSVYLSTGNNTTGSTMKVWVKPVAADYALAAANTFASMTEGATQIYDGTGDYTTSQQGWVEFPFASALSVTEGQKLLVMVRGTGCTTGGGCSRQVSSTTTTANTVWKKAADNTDPGMSTTGDLLKTRPNIQFCFETSDCRSLTRLNISEVEKHSAHVSWMPGNQDTSWQCLLSTAEVAEADRDEHDDLHTIANVLDLDLTGLTSDMDYHFYMRPICDASNPENLVVGNWTECTFTTLASCGQPTVAEATEVSYTSAKLHVTAHATVGTPAGFEFRYWKQGASTAADTLTAVTTDGADSVVVTGLLPNTQYYYDVRTNCGTDDGYSRWSATTATFRTKLQPNELPYTTLFAAERDNEWVLENGERTNKWSFGTAATNHGTRGLYISNDGGESNAISLVNNYLTYAYSAFNFEAGKQYTIGFDLKVKGHSQNAYLNVYLAPEDAAPSATGTSTSVPVTWKRLGTANLYNKTEWQHVQFNEPVAKDTTMRLIFVWYNNGSAVASANPPAAIDSLVIRESDKYNVVAAARLTTDDTAMGTITSLPETLTGLYVGTEVTLTATPKYGYTFTNWTTTGDAVVGTEAVKTFTLTKDTALTANFDSMLFTITGTTPSSLGHVEITGVDHVEGQPGSSATVKFNTPVVMTAVSHYGGIRGNKWLDEQNHEVGYGETFIVQANRNATFRAFFDTAEYHITAVVTKDGNNNPMGIVTGPMALRALAYDSLQATPYYGYHFVNWTRGDGPQAGEVITTNAVLPVDFRNLAHDTTDFTVNANFDYNQYTVIGVANEAEGSVSGGGLVNYLTDVTLTAHPTPCYHFVNWTNADGVEQGTDTSITVRALRDSALMAHFALNVYTGDTTASECDAFTWHDSTYTVTPEVAPTFVYKTANNCDSVVTLHLTIRHSTTGDTTAVECDQFAWHGVTYNATPATAPTHVYTNAAGCDSVVTLHLTINHSNTGDTSAVVCDEFEWYGTTYTSTPAVAPTHVFGNIYGCDSVVTLHLTVNHSSTGDTFAVVCDQFTWYGTTYTNTPAVAPTHLFAGANQYGCDSLVTLHLTVNHSNTGDTTAVACDSYSWYEHTNLTASSNTLTHTFAGANAAGCDSTVTLNLTVNYSNTGVDVRNECDSYTWINNVTYTQTPGIAPVWTLTNAAGCDSVVTLNLTIRYSTKDSVFADVCDSLTWTSGTGLKYTESTVAYHVITNVAGCDSVRVLNLHVDYSTTGEESVTACNEFLWHDSTYSATGDYTYETRNLVGCDSLATLHLTINHCATTNIVACDSYKWGFNGQTYTVSGQYIEGTDTLNLVINHSNSGIDEQTACDQFTWIDRQVYTTSTNEPTYHLTNVAGCDSTVTLHLTVNYSNSGSETVAACDSFAWYGQTYRETPGIAPIKVLTNVAGCDSVATLFLTVSYSKRADTAAVACDSYTWYDMVLAKSADTTKHFLTAAGCDSAVTLHLTVNYSNSGDTTAVACDQFTWYGTTYTSTPAVAPTHVFTNVAGCDSVVTLHLTVNNSQTVALPVLTVCDSLLWNGMTLTESCDTAYTIAGANGCDSTTTLHLTVNYSSTGDTSAVACDQFTWYGTTYTSTPAVAPTHVFTNAAQCDSVVTLHLTVNHSSTSDTTAVACDSLLWNGEWRTASGTYSYNTTNAAQCDSVATLHLTVNNSQTVALPAVTVCDSLLWNGEWRVESGEYRYSTLGSNGCDSTTTLQLTVNHSNSGDTTAVACDSFTWYGTAYTSTPAVAPTHTFTNVEGCDSVVTLHLTVNHSDTGDTTAVACDSLLWNGEWRTASGEYSYNTTNIAGCDSTVTLHLTVNHSNSGDTTAVACDQFTWYGTAYTSTPAVAPTHTFTNVEGCDSVVTLHLTVNYSTTGIEEDTACDAFTWHGTEYYVSTTTPTFTETAINGCDSVVTLHLTVNYSSTGIQTVTACDSYTWINNVTYTASTNVPTYTVTNGVGCDSVVTLRLTINHSSTSDTFAVACDSFTWYDTTYTSTPAVAPTHVFTNVAGCDSTVTLHLTVNYSNTGVENVTACDSYLWHGTTYTASNNTATYTDTNVAGCDSVVTLHLTVNYSNTGVENVTACDSYLWHGTTYTASNNTATFTETNVAGCDSVVTLNLTVNYSSTGDTSAVACDQFTWYGTTYTSTPAVAPTHTFTNVEGCDSVVTLNLTVNHSSTGDTNAVACDSLFWNGEWRTESGEYNRTILNGNAAGCDSVVTLHLTVNHSQTVPLPAMTVCDSLLWNGEWRTESGEYSYTTTNVAGCDSTTTLQLTVNYSSSSDTSAVAVDSLFWNGEWRTESGAYSYTTTNIAGCDSTVTLNLTIVPHKLTVTLYSMDTAMGVVSPDTVSYVTPGNLFTAAATAHEGYHFVAWHDGVDTVSTESIYTFAVTADITLTALFDVNPSSYTVTAVANDTTMGEVFGAGEYAAGSTAVLIARPKAGYRFISWNNGVTDSVITFIVTEDVSFTAIFSTVGIDGVDEEEATVYSVDNKIVVKGAEQRSIYIYDVNGRCVRHQATVSAETVEFTMTATGVYLVKVGKAPAKRVVVLR